MRLWITLALLGGSAVAAVRHAMGHRHTILIPLLLVPALFLGWQEWRFQSDEAEFSSIATTIAGRPVHIHCQRFSGALLDVTAEAGYVEFTAQGTPTDTGHIERDACNDLRHYLHSDKTSPTLEQVISVQVLSHESFHLAGIKDEAATECAALQRLDDVAEALGATPAQSDALAAQYLAEVYPRMPAPYRSADCVDGGLMDDSPGDGYWP